MLWYSCCVGTWRSRCRNIMLLRNWRVLLLSLGLKCCVLLLLSLLIGRILLHLYLESYLILSGNFFELLLLFGCECTPVFTKDTAHFNKFNIWKLLRYNWTHFIGEKNVCSRGTFWGIWILWCSLPSLFWKVVLKNVTLSIMSRRRNILSHLLFITLLVLLSSCAPAGLLFYCKILVHV